MVNLRGISELCKMYSTDILRMVCLEAFKMSVDGNANSRWHRNNPVSQIDLGVLNWGRAVFFVSEKQQGHSKKKRKKERYL